MKTLLRIFFLPLFFLSCSSDLNFDQAKNLILKPVFVANLATFDIKESQFFNAGIEKTFVTDVMNFMVFNDIDVNKNIKKTELFFEITNTINRDYKIDLYLLDGNFVKLYTIPFVVPAYQSGRLPVTKKEIFENTTLEILRETQNFAFEITMLPGNSLSGSSLGSLKLSSSATIYIEAK